MIEFRDQTERELTNQMQNATQERMDQMQRAIDLLIQNQSQSFGGQNSNNDNVLVTSSTSAFHVKDISLGFPHFDGHTPVLEWIFKAEKFFNYHHTPDADRVDIAAIHFEKEVIPWFQMLQRLNSVNTWQELTRALESQFGPSPFECPMTELFKLQQTSTVSDYYLKFMASGGLSPEALLKCFIGGLNKDIRRYVMALCPGFVIRAVALAKLYEEKYVPDNGHKNTSYNHRYSTVYSSTSRNTSNRSIVKQNLPPLLPTPTLPPSKNNAVKKITPVEMQLRREKGLCYFCDDKFTFNHKCPNRQYLLLIEVDHHLSLNALKRGQGVGTIRFMATINGFPIKVLVDGGSSDNFLQPRVAKFLELPVEPTPLFRVMVGNGNYMTAEGMIRDLTVSSQGSVFHLPVFLLPVSGADLILGASWLKIIGPYIADYEALQLKFLHQGQFTTLQGDTKKLPIQAHLHSIRRMVHVDSIAKIFSLQVVESDTSHETLLKLLETVALELALLLRTYSSVFDTPTSLPPTRAHDHSIPLIEGFMPVKVKPYRYSHSQKEEIERLVEDMLIEGIIQPSKSPFSSPIILVKKKDGSWRVCTDYRALNAITIKDTFPIPIVDELID
uniref:Transposon Ty3-I Gag-Pol polyprotein n=1 Tax=Cajanus cajan TaxID=3821 RepID=A0A151S1G0_CAJCA|nr:Transposon Ty3-I Gag-Pol polyprotein [Cajanus cajan]